MVCRAIALSSSTSFSSWIRRLAKDSAARVYSVALAASPFLVASSAISTAWRALAFTFSSSSLARVRRISACFCWAMTLAACSLSRRCWSCASTIACSSWIFGSAFSLNFWFAPAVMYFHTRLKSLIMRGSLRVRSLAGGAAGGPAEPQGPSARRGRRRDPT